MRIAAPMLAVAAVVSMAACVDSTAPRAVAVQRHDFVFYAPEFGHKPPPPADTSAAVALESGEVSSTFRVLFNMNLEGTAGWLRFGVQQDENAYGTPGAQITFSGSTQQPPRGFATNDGPVGEGVISGKGTFVVHVREGLLQITLGRNIEDKQSFIDGNCSQSADVGYCGQIHFVGAKVFDANGVPLHYANGVIRIGVPSSPGY